jgi:hypothetical protein
LGIIGETMDTSTRIQKINEALTQLDERASISKGQLAAMGLRYGVELSKKVGKTIYDAVFKTRMGRDILRNVAINKALSAIGPKGNVGMPKTQGISPAGMDDPSQQYGSHTDMPGRSPTLNWQIRNSYRGQ